MLEGHKYYPNDKYTKALSAYMWVVKYGDKA